MGMTIVKTIVCDLCNKKIDESTEFIEQDGFFFHFICIKDMPVKELLLFFLTHSPG